MFGGVPYTYRSRDCPGINLDRTVNSYEQRLCIRILALPSVILRIFGRPLIVFPLSHLALPVDCQDLASVAVQIKITPSLFTIDLNATSLA